MQLEYSWSNYFLTRNHYSYLIWYEMEVFVNKNNVHEFQVASFLMPQPILVEWLLWPAPNTTTLQPQFHILDRYELCHWYCSGKECLRKAHIELEPCKSGRARNWLDAFSYLLHPGLLQSRNWGSNSSAFLTPKGSAIFREAKRNWNIIRQLIHCHFTIITHAASYPRYLVQSCQHCGLVNVKSIGVGHYLITSHFALLHQSFYLHLVRHAYLVLS